MDDGADVDLVDVSPIGSPSYHSQITMEQQWRGEEPDSDEEIEDVANIAAHPKYNNGSPPLLPHLQRGFRRPKPLTLDPNLSPPFLYSPGYPSTIEGTPSPLSYASDYFDIGENSPLPPTKPDDTMWFNPYPGLLVYVRKLTLLDFTIDLHP